MIRPCVRKNIQKADNVKYWIASTATALAEFAHVSVSTIERIERGERVSRDALDRIAQAFGYESGYFTAPRVPLPRDEAAASMVEQFRTLRWCQSLQ